MAAGVKRPASCLSPEKNSRPTLDAKCLSLCSEKAARNKAMNDQHDWEGVLALKSGVNLSFVHEVDTYRFYSLLEDYTNESENSGCSIVDLWVMIIDYLSDVMSRGVHHSSTLAHFVLYRGMRDHPNAVVRNACKMFMDKLMLEIYPPADESSRLFYLDLFFRDSPLDKSDSHASFAWENFSLLMQDIVCSRGQIGHYLLFDYLVKVLEKDLYAWLRQCSISELPILASMLWCTPDDGGWRINHKIKAVIRNFSIALSLSKRIKSLMRRLVSLIARLVDATDKLKRLEDNSRKSALVSELTDSIGTNMSKWTISRLCSEIFLLDPDWLAEGVGRKLLLSLKASSVTTDETGLRPLINSLVEPDRIIVITEQDNADQSNCQAAESVTKIPRNKYGETPLHVACRNGNIEKIHLLLQQSPHLINVRDFNEWTPLHEASCHGHAACVELLLQRAPELSPLGGGSEAVTPLQEAARLGHAHVVKLLLEHHAKAGSLFEALKELHDMLANIDQATYAVIQPHLLRSERTVLLRDPLRYYVLASLVVYKYCATFRLHAIKAHMKAFIGQTTPALHLGPKYPYCQVDEMSPLLLASFPIRRCDRTAAEDIRTFWLGISKNPYGNPCLEMMAKASRFQWAEI